VDAEAAAERVVRGRGEDMADGGDDGLVCGDDAPGPAVPVVDGSAVLDAERHVCCQQRD